jgi:tetraacyldisaccharide 4'-kinase
VKARRGWAWPLVPLYAAGLAVKDGLRGAGVLRVRKLKWPVVSVGSLSAGGAGKTPVVIALAELLRERGWDVDVLSRGYGREGSGVERVDAEAEGAARRFGDEPVVIARRAGVPVWVGAQRFAAGAAAEARARTVESSRKVHLLDDGFQHRALARAVDVVLVTEADLEDALLPAGNRRERLAALGRADVVVLREEEQERLEARVRGWMRADAAIWSVRRTVDFPEAGNVLPGDRGLVAFCAIARPENFLETLRTGGVRVVVSTAFPDHHRYTADGMRRLTEACRVHGGDAFVTTEKDAVKITPELRAQLEAAAPLLVARLSAAFADPDAVVRELEARIA